MFQAAGSERHRSALRRAEILPSCSFVARTSNSSLVSGPNRSVAGSGRRWRRKKLPGTVGLAGIRSGAAGVVAVDDRRQLPVRAAAITAASGTDGRSPGRSSLGGRTSWPGRAAARVTMTSRPAAPEAVVTQRDVEFLE
jgi:hypothetical protein